MVLGITTENCHLLTLALGMPKIPATEPVRHRVSGLQTKIRASPRSSNYHLFPHNFKSPVTDLKNLTHSSATFSFHITEAQCNVTEVLQLNEDAWGGRAKAPRKRTTTRSSTWLVPTALQWSSCDKMHLHWQTNYEGEITYGTVISPCQFFLGIKEGKQKKTTNSIDNETRGNKPCGSKTGSGRNLHREANGNLPLWGVLIPFMDQLNTTAASPSTWCTELQLHAEGWSCGSQSDGRLAALFRPPRCPGCSARRTLQLEHAPRAAPIPIPELVFASCQRQTQEGCGNTWWWPPADSLNHKCTLRLCFGQTLVWVVYFYYFLITLIEGGIFPFISPMQPLHLLPPSSPFHASACKPHCYSCCCLTMKVGWAFPPPFTSVGKQRTDEFH